jgi:hypothetical protein
MFSRRIVEFLHKRIFCIFSLLAFGELGERWFLSLQHAELDFSNASSVKKSLKIVDRTSGAMFHVRHIDFSY